MAADNKRLERLENLVGQPSGELSKPLFDMVSALNKEVLELRMKIQKMEKLRKLLRP